MECIHISPLDMVPEKTRDVLHEFGDFIFDLVVCSESGYPVSAGLTFTSMAIVLHNTWMTSKDGGDV